MAEACPQCGSPYGKRRRCYKCTSAPRLGEKRPCVVCGKEFYAPRWALNDITRNSGVYCSRACKYQGQGANLQGQRAGDLTVASNGYLLAWAPEHPRAHNGRIGQHILVMEQALGRYLERGEQVHHLDRDKTNNALANLEVLSSAEHARLHAAEQRLRARRVSVTCAACGKAFETKASRATASDPRNRTRFCSVTCRGKAGAKAMNERIAAKRAADPRSWEIMRLRQRITNSERYMARLRAELEQGD
jgi:hypothetical protein